MHWVFPKEASPQVKPFRQWLKIHCSDRLSCPFWQVKRLKEKGEAEISFEDRVSSSAGNRELKGPPVLPSAEKLQT